MKWLSNRFNWVAVLLFITAITLIVLGIPHPTPTPTAKAAPDPHKGYTDLCLDGILYWKRTGSGSYAVLSPHIDPETGHPKRCPS